jgi:methyl-accepting chemotaxis protein
MSSQAEQLQQAMAFFRLANTPVANVVPMRRGPNRAPRAAKTGAKATGHTVLAFAGDAADESNFTRF